VPRYGRVTFEKSLVAPRGQREAQLLAPGHPLLDATVDLVLERYRPLLKQGAVLVAEGDESEEPRALVYVEHGIQNARELADGQRQIVSKRLQFIELSQDWEPRVAGYAPYLDYRPIEPDELGWTMLQLQAARASIAARLIGSVRAVRRLASSYPDGTGAHRRTFIFRQSFPVGTTVAGSTISTTVRPRA
jgi:hypothetical protein